MSMCTYTMWFIEDGVTTPMSITYNFTLNCGYVIALSSFLVNPLLGQSSSLDSKTKQLLMYIINALLIILQFTIAEGTTTNGDYLLPFKTGAFLAKAPVQPVILRYPYKRFNAAWDSMSGVSITDKLS